MKIFIALLLTTFSLTIRAEIEPRHRQLIEQAIANKCGVMVDLELISTEIVEDHIDQGVVDLYFFTVFKGTQNIDQGLFDEYHIEVESERGDFYDHQAQAHGFYEIHDVSCESA